MPPLENLYCFLSLIDESLLDSVTEQVKASDRFRMNYNLHE
jgi:hypothetical protein